ncbi:hypothetical protein [Brevibacillus brevis]
MKKVSKIVLSEEQSKKFLSFFVQEAIELAKKRLEEGFQMDKAESDS